LFKGAKPKIIISPKAAAAQHQNSALRIRQNVVSPLALALREVQYKKAP
jgi:hypothetical protein